MVRRVFYPGLQDAIGHAVARKQMTGFGAMLAFELDAEQVSTDAFLHHLDIVRPAVTSHAKMSAEERRRVGVTDALLRLSVGIEHIDDLIADFDQALKLSTV